MTSSNNIFLITAQYITREICGSNTYKFQIEAAKTSEGVIVVKTFWAQILETAVLERTLRSPSPKEDSNALIVVQHCVNLTLYYNSTFFLSFSGCYRYLKKPGKYSASKGGCDLINARERGNGKRRMAQECIRERNNRHLKSVRTYNLRQQKRLG